MHTTALGVFCLVFLLVTVAGFWAVRWRRPAAGMHSLEEWGLAGRSFGTWVTWFLIGGDLYTAYTVIAVPAALYGAGAMGFFAVPYAVIAYPYMMLVLPRIWTICHRHGYITFADFVGGRYGNRWLTAAVAVTGILALMPYIALQLVGMRVVIAALGVTGEWPLAAAFVILAAYTYSSGLRAPAVIAIVKDVMLYVMVIAALIVLPWKLGGYAHVFAAGQPGARAAQAGCDDLPPTKPVPRLLHPGHRLRDRADALSPHRHGGAEREERQYRPPQCRDAARLQLPARHDRPARLRRAGRRRRHQGRERRGAVAVSEDVSRVVRRLLPGRDCGRRAGARVDHVDRGVEPLHTQPLRRIRPQRRRHHARNRRWPSWSRSP